MLPALRPQSPPTGCPSPILPPSRTPDMESMVERVARAIMCAREDGGCIVQDWCAEERDNPHVAQALRQARAAIAAIAAMREPTEEMMSDLGGECLKWAPGA